MRLLSFPWKRESRVCKQALDSRLRGNDRGGKRRSVGKRVSPIYPKFLPNFAAENNRRRTYVFGVIPVKTGIQIAQYSPGLSPAREWQKRNAVKYPKLRSPKTFEQSHSPAKKLLASRRSEHRLDLRDNSPKCGFGFNDVPPYAECHSFTYLFKGGQIRRD